MAFPVVGKNVGSGVDQLKAQIVGWIREEIRASQRGGNGLHVDGATGDLVADIGQFRSNNYVPGSAGWGMKPNGNAEFNDLTIRGGIIGNDALTSPVVPGVGGGSATGWAVSTTSTAKASVAIAIPTGFTQALVHVTAAAAAANPTVAGDLLYVRAAIILPGGATTDGSELDNFADTGQLSTASASLAAVFSGLSPGSITVACKVRATTTWAANAANLANVDASIVFLR